MTPDQRNRSSPVAPCAVRAGTASPTSTTHSVSEPHIDIAGHACDSTHGGTTYGELTNNGVRVLTLLDSKSMSRGASRLRASTASVCSASTLGAWLC